MPQTGEKEKESELQLDKISKKGTFSAAVIGTVFSSFSHKSNNNPALSCVCLTCKMLPGLQAVLWLFCLKKGFMQSEGKRM